MLPLFPVTPPSMDASDIHLCKHALPVLEAYCLPAALPLNCQTARAQQWPFARGRNAPRRCCHCLSILVIRNFVRGCLCPVFFL